MGSREDLLYQDGNLQDSNTIASEATNRERDIGRKGIERLEKQISQLIGSTITNDQVNIALLKKVQNS